MFSAFAPSFGGPLSQAGDAHPLCCGSAARAVGCFTQNIYRTPPKCTCSVNLGNGEVAQLVACLLCTKGDLGSDLQLYSENWAWWHLSVIQGLDG